MLQLIILLLVATTIAFANVVEYEVIQDAVKTSQVEMRNEFKESLDENLGLIKKELKAMRADNLALHKELSAARSTIRTLDSVTTTTANSECVDKDEVVKLVSRLLDSHATKQNVLNSRVKVLEEQESRALAPPTPKRKSRRLVDASVLEDAALWMQASGAKVLFGPEADANLYRSGTSELKTDSTVVIKKDLKVWGENWNLATLMEAQEDVAVGDVISMCQGKACVGYGLQHTGYKQSSKAVNQVKTLWMGGTSSLAVMYYLQPGATEFNVPIMRMVKPQDSAGAIGGDPAIGPEVPFHTEKVFAPQLCKLDNEKFLIAYRKTISPGGTSLDTATDVQGAIKLGEINSIPDSTFKASDEVLIPNIGGFGIKRLIPVSLGPKRFAVAIEQSDQDNSGNWLGTGNIAIGNIALSSGGDRGITIGASVEFSTYVSSIHAASFNDFKHVAIAYRERNALSTQDRGRIVIIATSTSTPSVVTRFTFAPKQVRFMDLTVIATKKMVLLYRLPKSQFMGKGVILTLTTSDTTIESTKAVAIADPSAYDNSYVLSTALINPGQIVMAYRNGLGKPRLVDIDIVGTTLVVGTSRTFHVADPASFSYDVCPLGGSTFLLAFQDNKANIANAGTTVVGSTHGGALRVGVATTAGLTGETVQVAVEGAVKIPVGTVRLGISGISMTPGARYYAKYDGGVSSSPDDGILLGRALRDNLLLLERDFAGGFEPDSVRLLLLAETIQASTFSVYPGEIRALAGSTIPSGWLICDGRAVSRLNYATLFSVIGTTWGTGDGGVTFNIPDLRGRLMIGMDVSAQGTYPSVRARNIGTRGGEVIKCDRTSSPGTNYGSHYGECHKGANNNGGANAGDMMPPYGVVNYMIKT